MTKHVESDLFEITIVTHFHKDDPEGVGDYASKVMYLNGKKVIELHDSYHEYGKYWDGFEDALDLVYGKDKVVVFDEMVADYDY